jgi:hypothetical protein
MSDKSSFFTELKRRNVIRVAGLYLDFGGAARSNWVISQFAGSAQVASRFAHQNHPRNRRHAA